MWKKNVFLPYENEHPISQHPVNRFGCPDPFVMPTHRERSMQRIILLLRVYPDAFKPFHINGIDIGTVPNLSISDAKIEPPGRQGPVERRGWAPKRAQIETLVQRSSSQCFSFQERAATRLLALPTITTPPPSPPRKVSQQWWRRVHLPTGRVKGKVAGELTTSFAVRQGIILPRVIPLYCARCENETLLQRFDHLYRLEGWNPTKKTLG
jgi:hypothetical protein